MKISEAVDCMSKSYLDRVIGSFSPEVKKLSETQARTFIKKNIREIKQRSQVQSSLKSFANCTYDQRILMREIIRFLLMERHCEIPEEQFYESLKAFLKDLVKRYRDKKVLDTIPKRKVEIVQALYEIAATDSNISNDEEELLNRLKEKLELTKAQFSAALNTVTSIKKLYTFTDAQIEEALRTLQWRGLVYQLNEASPRQLIIPEEIAQVLAKEFEYPLDRKSFSLLLGKLSRSTLGRLAKVNGLATYGTEDQLTMRLWCQGKPAVQLLEEVNQVELVKVARSIEVKVSGPKNSLIENIVNYFFELDAQPLAKAKKISEAELWEYYPQIAKRDALTLRQLGLIKKDIEMERIFEDLTRYAFRKLGGLKLIKFSGNNNPDGGAWDEMESSLLLWDNKSQERPYSFPLGHHKQFLQYIVNSKKPVSSFLVITPGVENESVVEQNCIRLSGESQRNVAVIGADTFKRFVDQHQHRIGGPLNTQIFNHPGVLTDEILDMRARALK